mmetsp:Transcript_67675/g.151551  ORF Transcript_67675/g.151551 Transcript_67675/m.151551 type:complete len:216 (-) Transcript_67675:323-970(-)
MGTVHAQLEGLRGHAESLRNIVPAQVLNQCQAELAGRIVIHVAGPADRPLHAHLEQLAAQLLGAAHVQNRQGHAPATQEVQVVEAHAIVPGKVEHVDTMEVDREGLAASAVHVVPLELRDSPADAVRLIHQERGLPAWQKQGGGKVDALQEIVPHAEDALLREYLPEAPRRKCSTSVLRPSVDGLPTPAPGGRAGIPSSARGGRARRGTPQSQPD